MAYTYMVASLCLVLIDYEEVAGNLNEITFLNSFDAQGWVYEEPANCDEIIHTPGDKLDLLIASHTHTYSQFSN